MSGKFKRPKIKHQPPSYLDSMLKRIADSTRLADQRAATPERPIQPNSKTVRGIDSGKSEEF